MNIIAFAASNSSQSINKKLVQFSATLIPEHTVEVLDLNDYEPPLFSVDRERQIGQPQPTQDFLAKLNSADALIISFAEHNGTYSAAYKNLYDWVSRIQKKVYQDKPVVLLSTSPGPGGAKNVLSAAVNSFPHFGAIVVGSLSVPSFYEHFDSESGQLTHDALKSELSSLLKKLS